MLPSLSELMGLEFQDIDEIAVCGMMVMVYDGLFDLISRKTKKHLLILAF